MALGSIAALLLEKENSFHDAALAKTPFAKLNIILPICKGFWKKCQTSNLKIAKKWPTFQHTTLHQLANHGVRPSFILFWKLCQLLKFSTLRTRFLIRF